MKRHSLEKVLGDGEVAMLADSKLWHNAQPIRTIDHDEMGYMDVFVLTAKGCAQCRFTLNDVRQQFSALGQYHNGKPVTF